MSSSSQLLKNLMNQVLYFPPIHNLLKVRSASDAIS